MKEDNEKEMVDLFDKFDCHIFMAKEDEFKDEDILSLNCHSSTMFEMLRKAFLKYPPLAVSARLALKEIESSGVTK